MSARMKILTGVAGLTALVGLAAPAASQGYPYGGYNQGYGYNSNGGVVGAIINSVIGGGRYGGYGYNGYGANTQVAVRQCAAAVEQRLNGGYGGYGAHDAYGNHVGGYGSNAYGGARVVAITHADRHSRGTVKVKGLATSGNNQGYGGYGGYGGGYGGYGNSGYNTGADLSFNCRVDRYGRIVNLDINRSYNGYGYNRGY